MTQNVPNLRSLRYDIANRRNKFDMIRRQPGQIQRPLLVKILSSLNLRIFYPGSFQKLSIFSTNYILPLHFTLACIKRSCLGRATYDVHTNSEEPYPFIIASPSLSLSIILGTIPPRSKADILCNYLPWLAAGRSKKGNLVLDK